MSQVLKAATARYPILDAGCSNTRIWHRASSNKHLFIGLRCLLASFLLIVIPVFTLNNLELNAVHAGQIPMVKKIYGENRKQEMVEISLNDTEVKVVSGSKGKIYSIDADDKSECIVASIEVTGDPNSGVVYAKITGKSNTIEIKQGDYVKFLPQKEIESKNQKIGIKDTDRNKLPLSEDAVKRVKDLLDDALMLYREGEYGEAVNKWGEVLIVDPENLEAKFNIEIAKEKIKSLETTSQSGRKR